MDDNLAAVLIILGLGVSSLIAGVLLLLAFVGADCHGYGKMRHNNDDE